MISVIIPAYNEAGKIVSTISEISEYLQNRDYEIIVVDDGSSDNTAKIAFENNFKNTKILSYKKNKGKGYAVKLGLLEAKGEYILFSDADLSTPINELDKLLKVMNEKNADVVIASRGLKDSNIAQSQGVFRKSLGKTFNLIVQLLVLRGISDTQCGFKLFTHKAAKIIGKKQTIEGFGFDIEQLYIAKKEGFKVKEIPVTWNNDTNSKVNPIKDSLKMLIDIFKVRWRHK